jgi:hypothetical protein
VVVVYNGGGGYYNTGGPQVAAYIAIAFVSLIVLLFLIALIYFCILGKFHRGKRL